MLCTYCGRGHTAAACPTRPRRWLGRMAAVMLAGPVLGACTTAEPPPAKLAPPPADLMQEPAPLVPIPDCDGAVDCRARYYATSRRQYSDLAQRHRGLQRWVRVGQAK